MRRSIDGGAFLGELRDLVGERVEIRVRWAPAAGAVLAVRGSRRGCSRFSNGRVRFLRGVARHGEERDLRSCKDGRQRRDDRRVDEAGPGAQRRSRMVAIPWPPPMHCVLSA